MFRVEREEMPLTRSKTANGQHLNAAIPASSTVTGPQQNTSTIAGKYPKVLLPNAVLT